LGERVSGTIDETLTEPLIVSASIEGLKAVMAEMSSLTAVDVVPDSGLPEWRKYVDHARKLDEIAQDMDSLINRLERAGRVPILVIGESDIAARQLMYLPSGEATLGERTVWEAQSRHIITYAATLRVNNLPEMMPQPAVYYPADQMLIGDSESVIPFFQLCGIRQSGGRLRVIPKPD
jgi:hypothetical protein